ncbi:MAG: NUDIX domain-containing protein [Deltaproteobacteria bacterium]|nr:NUDIX domain-containing protein [Deltaproteobacteria bacterium]
MSTEAVATWSFAMVVVRLGRRFLVVKERKHGQLWYLPAGRVERGETFAQAAVRETLEEGGVPVTLEGVLRVEHSPTPEDARMRVFFVARPSDDTTPKSAADEHTLEARWVTLDELAELPTRGDEVRAAFEYVLSGGPVYPLSVLTAEGARWPSLG